MKQSREENLLGKVRSIEIISTWYYVGTVAQKGQHHSKQIHNQLNIFYCKHKINF
jgi:hypothetical protein